MPEVKGRCDTCDIEAPLFDRILGARICAACGLSIESEQWICLSCGVEPVNQGMLFCGGYCRMVAEKIRYERKKTATGQLESDPLVLRAVEVGRALVASGQVYENNLTPEVREAVFAVKGRRCARCGSEEKGLQIDHIDGRSNEPANLQPLCRDCHDEKTLASIRTVAPGDADYANVSRRMHEYIRRVGASPPLQGCDDERRWDPEKVYQSVGQWRAKLLGTSPQRLNLRVNEIMANVRNELHRVNEVGGG